jgi:hypothetical protein
LISDIIGVDNDSWQGRINSRLNGPYFYLSACW